MILCFLGYCFVFAVLIVFLHDRCVPKRPYYDRPFRGSFHCLMAFLDFFGQAKIRFQNPDHQVFFGGAVKFTHRQRRKNTLFLGGAGVIACHLQRCSDGT